MPQVHQQPMNPSAADDAVHPRPRSNADSFRVDDAPAVDRPLHTMQPPESSGSSTFSVGGSDDGDFSLDDHKEASKAAATSGKGTAVSVVASAAPVIPERAPGDAFVTAASTAKPDNEDPPWL